MTPPAQRKTTLPVCPECGSATFWNTTDGIQTLFCISDDCKWKQEIRSRPAPATKPVHCEHERMCRLYNGKHERYLPCKGIRWDYADERKCECDTRSRPVPQTDASKISIWKMSSEETPFPNYNRENFLENQSLDQIFALLRNGWVIQAAEEETGFNTTPMPNGAKNTRPIQHTCPYCGGYTEIHNPCDGAHHISPEQIDEIERLFAMPEHAMEEDDYQAQKDIIAQLRQHQAGEQR